jgi:hypothetical protein
VYAEGARVTTAALADRLGVLIEPPKDLAPRMKANEVFGEGRICWEPDCCTILCRYNPGPRCFVHTEMERVYRSRQDAIRALRAQGEDPRRYL